MNLLVQMANTHLDHGEWVLTLLESNQNMCRPPFMEKSAPVM